MMVSMIQSTFRGMGQGSSQTPRIHVPGSRRALLSARRPPQHLCAWQASLPDDHSWLRRKGRCTLVLLRRNGRRYAAARQTQIILNRVDYGPMYRLQATAHAGINEGSSQTMAKTWRASAPKEYSDWKQVFLLRLESVIAKKLGWPMGESDGGFGRYECIETANKDRPRIRCRKRDARRRRSPRILRPLP